MRRLVILAGLLLLVISCSERIVTRQRIEFAQVLLDPTPFHPGMISENDRAEREGVWLNLKGIYALDRRRAFLYGIVGGAWGRSVLLHSEDGGRTWCEVMPSIPRNTVLRVTFLENGYGWAIAARTVGDLGLLSLYRSTDYGQHWEQISRIQNDRGIPYGMMFFDSQYGQIKMIYYTANPYSDRLAILTTNDGGHEWKETGKIPIWESWDGVSALHMVVDLANEEEVKERLEALAGWSVAEEGWCNEECESVGWDGSYWHLRRDRAGDYVVSRRSGGDLTEVASIPSHYRYVEGRITLFEE